jgi:hypothetical protein
MSFPARKPGRRCSLGCESWPDDDRYSVCPNCGEETERFRNLYPLSLKEAESKVNHIKFEAFYEERCMLRGIPTTGPIPDDCVASGPVPKALLEVCVD